LNEIKIFDSSFCLKNYKNKDKNFKNELILILYVFFFKIKIIFIFFIQKYNPYLYGIISFGYDIYFYFNHCIKKDAYLKYELRTMFKCLYVLTILFLFIFSETIQFNFWGLNKHTIINEIKKSKIEESYINEFSIKEKTNFD